MDVLLSRLGRGAVALVPLLALGASPQAGDKRLTAEVLRGDLPIEVELSGVFVADDKDEIRIEPKAYRGELIITSLVPEGRAVKTGDLLIEFDPSNLDDSADDARSELGTKQVECEKARADLQAWEVENERLEGRARAEWAWAQRALEKVQAEAALTLEDKQHEVAEAEERLKNATVDLEQLCQLYEERELHTQTENILIERQKEQLEDTRRAARKARQQFDLWKQFESSNVIEEKELDVKDKEAEVRKLDIKAAAERQEKASAVTKAERALQKAEKKVAELDADAGSLKVLSPRDGIVFYGTLEGQDSPIGDVVFLGMGGSNDEMKIGGRVRTHQVLLTVASMDKLSVKMRALEGDIQHLKPGLPITVRPDAFPALHIAGELLKVDHVASRTGIFSDVREFSVLGKYDDLFPQLRSGMNCRVTVRADSIPDCLQVPILAVFAEGGEHFCFAGTPDGLRKRPVSIGATNGTMVEITEGLRTGETVRLYDPGMAP